MAEDFFKFIAKSIWERDRKISGIYFSNPIDFINYMHDQSEIKGRIFCENVMHNIFDTYPYVGETGYDRHGHTKSENEKLFAEIAKYFDDLLNTETQKIISEIKNPDSALDYLDEFVIERFKKIEKVIAQDGEITEWGKIRVAAFVENIFELKWFKEKKNRIKTPADFAKLRYGVVIDDQLKSAKEKDRKIHKEQLKKYFK